MERVLAIRTAHSAATLHGLVLTTCHGQCDVTFGPLAHEAGGDAYGKRRVVFSFTDPLDRDRLRRALRDLADPEVAQAFALARRSRSGPGFLGRLFG